MTAPLALITGVGRRRSIGAGIARGLAQDGWDLVLGYWRPYDERVDLERGPHDAEVIAAECRELGVEVSLVEADLADAATPEAIFAAIDRRVDALVLSHCEGVDSSILSTTIDSFDRHFAVNARASWLLIRAFAAQFPVTSDSVATGRIVALTSDHTAHNLPYGASKGALDRIVIATAVELADRGIRSNVVNPGPIDTGWMNDDVRRWTTDATPAGRLGTPDDIADLVRFLLSERGGWITGQLLSSNGGFRAG